MLSAKNVPQYPGIYYRRRPGSQAPPRETVIYIAGGELAFEIHQLRVTEKGTFQEYYDEVLVTNVGTDYLWSGPERHLE